MEQRADLEADAAVPARDDGGARWERGTSVRHVRRLLADVAVFTRGSETSDRALAGTGWRTATRSKQNVTRSATLTVPAGPPLKGLIPKSVCLTLNVPMALTVSGPTVTSAVTGKVRVVPSMVSSSCSGTFPVLARTESAAKVIVGYLSTCSTSVRMASVTLRISAVSGGVSTSRLSVGTVSRREEVGVPGW
jgi:hypothetical protein